MNDDATDESNTEGKETPDTSKEDKIEPTPAEKVRKDTEELRAENDAYDKEKLRAEVIRTDKQRGGISDAGQETNIKESNADYAKRVQSGEFNGPKEA